MSIQESFPKEMTPAYPLSEDIGELRTDSDAVTLVNVRGAFGKAIKRLRSEYPDLIGRFVLQDLSKTINQIDAVEAKKCGFELVVQDFFGLQLIEGAKYYHLRRVLHDQNDEPSIKILEATHEAIKNTSNYSTLLIHDIILPDVGCGFIESMVDLMMMQTCDGIERIQLQWHQPFEKSGFRIVKIWRADVGTTALIEAEIG